MKENTQIVLISFFVACLFYFGLKYSEQQNDVLTVSLVAFYGTALLQFALKIKGLLEKKRE